MSTTLNNITFFLNAKLYEKLIFLLPFSLILGNLAINLNIFLVIIFFLFENKKNFKNFFLKILFSFLYLYQ